MKMRVQAGTDIAALGAWDASRNDSSLARLSASAFSKALESEAAAGNLFLIRTGGDGGGPVDIFVDAEITEEVRKQSRPIKGEFLISLPTGQMVVGGAEDYRSDKPRTVSQDSVVTVPSGDYSIRCRVGKEEGGCDPPSRAQLESAMGREEYRYYRRVQNLALAAYFGTPGVFLMLTVVLGWKRALAPSAVAGAILYVAFRLWTRRDERFKRASKAEQDCWREARQREAPSLILELHKVSNTSGLKGGSIHL